MSEVAEQQSDAQEKQQGEQQQEQGEQEKTSYTKEEWDARQREFDSKAGKIRKNAEREAERRLLREVAARQQQGQPAAQQEKKVETELKEPKREDFEDYNQFLDARADYAGRKAVREERERATVEERERKAIEARAASEAEFKKRAKTVMDEIPDFAEAIEAAEDVMMTAAMGAAIEESEIGPRILYHLAKNPDESERISKLSPTGQLREIGKLEAKIEADLAAKKKAAPTKDDEGKQEQQEEDQPAKGEGEEPERDGGGRFKATDKKETRKAPEPIEPGSGRGANTSAEPSDNDPPDVWLRKREAQLAREQRAQRRAG